MNPAAAERDGTLRRGASFALASALVFGAGAPAAKLLLETIDPWIMAGLLYAGAGIGLGVLNGARRLTAPAGAGDPGLKGRGWLWFLAAALAGGVIGPPLLMTGLARTPASTGSLLLNLEAVLTVLVAFVLFREHIGRRVLIGVIGVVAGGISLAWQGGEGGQGGFAGVLGPLAIAGACFAWAIDNNLTQKIALADPLQIAMWRGLLAGTLNLGLAHLAGAGLPRWDLALAAGGLGFVGYGLALACFVFAVRDLGAARAGAFFATAPFIGAVLSVTALGEPLTLRLGIAGALMALGVWLLVTDRHEHEHEHETQSHEHRHRHDEHHRHAHGAEGQSGEPHSHVHTHAPLRHRHGHAPDEHHRHRH